MRILHIISDLILGGAERAMLALAETLKHAGTSQQVLSLGLVEPAAHECLAALEIDLLREGTGNPDAAITKADVILVHYWHTVAMQRFLRRPWPPARIVTWLFVVGDTVPQIVTADLVRFVDGIVATSRSTLALPSLAATEVPRICIHGIGDFKAIRERHGEPDGPVQVGYLGLVDFTKLHPDFVVMSAAVARPIQVPVWGGGGAYRRLRAQAEEAGCPERFLWNGPTNRIGDAFAQMHIFGYPLAPTTYASVDRALQEAMYAGLPAVVFDRPGDRDLVRDGETALVARDPHGYVEGVTRLADDAALRRRIGKAARAFIAATMDPQTHYRRFETFLADLVATTPKRQRAWPGHDIPAGEGARLFVDSLGVHAGPFAASFCPDMGAVQRAADEVIAGLPDPVRNPGAGGLFEYRRAFPDDPFIAFWCGLSELGRSAYPDALAYFLVARQQGLPAGRVSHWVEAAHQGTRRLRQGHKPRSEI